MKICECCRRCGKTAEMEKEYQKLKKEGKRVILLTKKDLNNKSSSHTMAKPNLRMVIPDSYKLWFESFMYCEW